MHIPSTFDKLVHHHHDCKASTQDSMENYPVKSTPDLDGELELVQTNRTGEVRELGLVDDAVFGQLDEDSPNYRNVRLSELLAC